MSDLVALLGASLRCLVQAHRWDRAVWAMDVALISLRAGRRLQVEDVEVCSRCGRSRLRQESRKVTFT